MPVSDVHCQVALACHPVLYHFPYFPVIAWDDTRNSAAKRCLAFAARNLSRCPETRLKDWKIARQNRQQYDSSDLAGNLQARKLHCLQPLKIFGHTSFFAGKTCRVCGNKWLHIYFFFFRWKLLIVTDCLIERSLKLNSFPYQVYLVRMWKTCLRWWCSTWMEPI